MAKIGRGSEQAMIRLPDGMRDELKSAAENNNRSMNAEIVARLADSVDGAGVAEKLQAENQALREKIAFQDGVISSLRQYLDIFIKHTAGSGVLEKMVFEDALNEIKLLKRSDAE